MSTVAVRHRLRPPAMPFRIGPIATAVLLLLGLMTIAPAEAQAEPHTYRMECLDYVGSGLISPITDVAQCTGGTISFYDTYDNHLVGTIDAFTMHQRTGPQTSLQDSYEACTANIICQIGIAAADTFILSKVKALWVIFKALI